MKSSILLVGNFLSTQGENRTMAEELAQRLEISGYSLIKTSKVRSRLPRLLDMLSTVFLRRADYQIAYVEIYSGPAFLWAEMVCLLLELIRKPYILTLHGGNLPAFARHWPGRVKRLFQGSYAVTAPSGYLQEEMRLYRKEIILLPNPLDIKKYPFHLRSISSPRIVWLRAFHNVYNPQMIPLVIANLCTTHPRVSLTMIGPNKGDGSMQETLAVIEKLGLQKNIKIISGILKNEVPEYLGQADVFINSSNVDNTPVSVLEALACGLCVVSTNVGGIPHLLDDAQDALLVPANDPGAMASAVRRILTEPKLAEKLSRNARLTAEQFDWSVIFPLWERLLNLTNLV